MHTVEHKNRQMQVGKYKDPVKFRKWKFHTLDKSVKIENFEFRMCETAKAGEVARLGGADSVLKGLAKSTMYGTNW